MEQARQVFETRYLIEPNRSMNRRAALWMVAGVALASFAVAGTLALRYGAWPILPFAGLEVALFAVVIGTVQSRGENQELLVLGESFLDVTRRHGGNVESFRFQRYFVRVNLRRALARNLPTRLEIGSHGKFVEIGSFLTDEERISLAENLSARLAGAPAVEKT